MKEEKIERWMRELVAVKSISGTEEEKKMPSCLINILSEMDYFKNNENQYGSYVIEEDYLKREIVYGLVRGTSEETVILTGHYDVVDAEDYGSLKEDAFDLKKLALRLEKEDLQGEAKEDYLSGEWIFGRGVCDMKGGIAVGLAVLEEWGNQTHKGKVPSLLFLAVPDEEAFSEGMRGAVKLLLNLKEQWNITYACLIDLEPCSRVEKTKQSISLGSVGKCMPVILVQGKTAHICDCFEGMNAIGILGEIYNRTELSLEFTEKERGESCVPPTWLSFKDLKKGYDVSVPSKAAGYMNMLSFKRTPEQIMSMLKKVCEESVEHYCSRIKVYSFEELVSYCKTGKEEEFMAFYDRVCQRAADEIKKGEKNYPQASIDLMEAVLEFSGLNEPAVVIGFAPPYYPAYHSDDLASKKDAGSKYLAILKKASEEKCGLKLQENHYFMGISDLSYTGNEAVCTEFMNKNMLLWGKMYQIDFEGINKLSIPSLLFGPWGKDLHKRTERVNRVSLTRELPEILVSFLEQMFDNKKDT